LGDGAKFSSVWKRVGDKWAVFLPGGDLGASYAASKGFEQLTQLNSGEGFWLNSRLAQSLVISGSPVYGTLTFKPGWIVVGVKVPGPLAIQALEQPVKSVWKWQTGKSTWAVALPAESDGGKAYAQQKGYVFMTAEDTLAPGEGFWVNK